MISSELTARQRKHVYMHSSIFDDSTVSTAGVGTAAATRSAKASSAREQEILNSLRDTLGNNATCRTEPQMPSAEEMRNTQNAGHPGAILPASHAHGLVDGGVHGAPRSIRTSSGHFAGADGEEAQAPLRSGPKDATIPKEFWQTSVNLQWHDPRNEICRQRGSPKAEAAPCELKRQELSSEIFGKKRLTEASTANPRQDLFPDTADHMWMDSHVLRCSHDAPVPRTPCSDARSRFQHNLHDSAQNPLASVDHEAAYGSPEEKSQQQATMMTPEDPRRRQERNFSDLFGLELAQRQDPGCRGGLLATHNASCFDMTSEIAVRNKERWKSKDETVADRRTAQNNSALFGRSTPDQRNHTTRHPEDLEAVNGDWAAAPDIDRSPPRHPRDTARSPEALAREERVQSMPTPPGEIRPGKEIASATTMSPRRRLQDHLRQRAPAVTTNTTSSYSPPLRCSPPRHGQRDTADHANRSPYEAARNPNTIDTSVADSFPKAINTSARDIKMANLRSSIFG